MEHKGHPGKHYSLVFEFAIRSSLPKNIPKPTIIHFFRFVVHEEISELCDTGVTIFFFLVQSWMREEKARKEGNKPKILLEKK